jgi:hypothetical protein
MREYLGIRCVAALNDEILSRFEFRRGHDALQ